MILQYLILKKLFGFLWFQGTPLSQEIIYNLEKRKEKLMNSQAMRNAMFLDPRHLFELTASECTQVKKDLVAIFKRFQGSYYF